MPSLGLNVRAAICRPPGMAISTCSPRGVTWRTAATIIRRGTGLIAGWPGGTWSPGLVTVPTPSPAEKVTSLPSFQDTVATISRPSVTSGSSPASLRTAAVAAGAAPSPGEDDAGTRGRADAGTVGANGCGSVSPGGHAGVRSGENGSAVFGPLTLPVSASPRRRVPVRRSLTPTLSRRLRRTRNTGPQHPHDDRPAVGKLDRDFRRRSPTRQHGRRRSGRCRRTSASGDPRPQAHGFVSPRDRRKTKLTDFRL